MMKHLFCLLALLTVSLVWAQRPDATVKATVTDAASGVPLEYATVSFQDTTGKLPLNGGITDEQGMFSQKIPAGNYIIAIEYIGYKTITLPARNVSGVVDLGTVSLKVDGELDEVVIVAERTEVEIKLDKRIYNVGKDLTVRGGTASDVLANIPSVTVDVDGTVALRGNQNVRILVNGKPSGITGVDPATALRSFPADAIERVEVITAPSARYDAEGQGGILNIILRREKTLGLNGNIALSAGDPRNYRATANINLRSDNFTVFAIGGYQDTKTLGNAQFDNNFFDPSLTTQFRGEDRRYDRSRKGWNSNTGIEWLIDKNTSLTYTLFLRDNEGINDTRNQAFDFDINSDLLDGELRTEDEIRDRGTVQHQLDWEKQFGEDSDHRLSFTFQLENSYSNEDNDITEFTTEPVETFREAERERRVDDQREIRLQGDYVLPMKNDTQFEAGFRLDFENNNTDYRFLESMDGIDFALNTDQSNVFDFDQKVYAAYAQYGTKFNKISMLAGLRMESSDINIQVIGAGLQFDKRYTDLFPTLNLGYAITDRQDITLGYNRRIRRPRGRFINPFQSRSSETNIFQGNPDLDPSYSNQVEVSYLKRDRVFTFGASVYFSRSTQNVNTIREDTGLTTEQGLPIIRSTPVNLSKQDRYGSELTYFWNASKKFRVNGSFNVFRAITVGSFEDQVFDAENTSWFTRIAAKYTLPLNIDFQTTAFYSGPSETAQTVTEGLLSINLAFAKDLFKDNATLTLNVSDLLNSRKRRSQTTTETFFQDSTFQWRERQITATFTYRFKQKKQRQRRGDGDGEFDDGDFGTP